VSDSNAVDMLKAGDLSQLAEAIACMTPSSMDKDGAIKVAVARAGAIRPLVAVLRESSDAPELQKQAARALHNLTSKNAENKVAVAHAGAVAPLVTILASGQMAAQEQAAGVLRNLTGSSPEQKAAVFAAGAVPAVATLLSAPEMSGDARANLAVLLYNLANGNPERRTAVAVERGVIAGLVRLVRVGPTATVKREAADTLQILALAGAKACKAMFEEGLVPLIRPLLNVTDGKTPKVGIQLRDALKKSGSAEVKDALKALG